MLVSHVYYNLLGERSAEPDSREAFDSFLDVFRISAGVSTIAPHALRNLACKLKFISLEIIMMPINIYNPSQDKITSTFESYSEKE